MVTTTIDRCSSIPFKHPTTTVSLKRYKTIIYNYKPNTYV